jgi:hypothetical protein
MKIHFNLPLGTNGWDKTIEMPAVPRIGDTVDFGNDDESDEHDVKYVVWTPNDAEIDAYVVLKSSYRVSQ